MFYAVLLEIFILYSAVKEFWKSVKIWESYCQKFGGFLLQGHGVFETRSESEFDADVP